MKSLNPNAVHPPAPPHIYPQQQTTNGTTGMQLFGKTVGTTGGNQAEYQNQENSHSTPKKHHLSNKPSMKAAGPSLITKKMHQHDMLISHSIENGTMNNLLSYHKQKEEPAYLMSPEAKPKLT